MKFLTSVRSLTLAVAAIASNIAPSYASQPDRIVKSPGQPEIVIYHNDMQSFAIGCQPLRALWARIPTQEVSPQEYQKIVNSAATNLAGHLHCNAPNLVRGYTSTAFPHAGVIVTRGTPFYVSTNTFFKAMGITPTKLTLEQGKIFISHNPQLNTNTVLEAR